MKKEIYIVNPCSLEDGGIDIKKTTIRSINAFSFEDGCASFVVDLERSFFSEEEANLYAKSKLIDKKKKLEKRISDYKKIIAKIDSLVCDKEPKLIDRSCYGCSSSIAKPSVLFCSHKQEILTGSIRIYGCDDFNSEQGEKQWEEK